MVEFKSPWMAVSSANFKMWIFDDGDLQLSVQMEQRAGDITVPWGAPTFNTDVSEQKTEF